MRAGLRSHCSPARRAAAPLGGAGRPVWACYWGWRGGLMDFIERHKPSAAVGVGCGAGNRGGDLCRPSMLCLLSVAKNWLMQTTPLGAL